MTSCIQVGGYESLGGTWCLLNALITYDMHTLCHNPEDGALKALILA